MVPAEVHGSGNKKQSPWNRIYMLEGEVRTQTQPNMLSAKLLQSCPTLWDLMSGSWLGSSVHGILQARILEWIAMPSSRGSSQPRCQASLMSPALMSRFSATSIPWEAPYTRNQINVGTQLGTVCSWSWRLTFESLPHNGLLPKWVWSEGAGPGSPRVGGHCNLPGIWSLK